MGRGRHGPRREAVTEHRQIDAGDGLTLHVEIDGEGLPLLLLHGFTGSAETWRPLVSRMRRRWRTVAVDLPGHGRSSSPRDSARYALPRLADDLSHALDALSIDRAAVLGYSLGGRAALHFSVRHPRRVSSLVLESASMGIADPLERRARAASDAELAAFIEREGIDAFVTRWERLPLWDSQAALPADTRAALRAQRLRNTPYGLANSLRGAGAGATGALTDELRTIEAPTLLIAGALDGKYVAAAKHMGGAIPGARVKIVENAGHAVHLERPEEFGGLVGEFLLDRPSSVGEREPHAP